MIAVQRSESNVGGAGNVARNIAALGARCIFVGLVGDDEAGRALQTALAEEARIEPVLIVDPSRPTTRKVRFVSEHFSTHMLRADWELAKPAAPEIEQRLLDAVTPLLARADIVLVDAASLSETMDGSLALDLADRIVLVLRAQEIDRGRLQKCFDALADYDDRLAGFAVVGDLSAA